MVEHVSDEGSKEDVGVFVENALRVTSTEDGSVPECCTETIPTYGVMIICRFLHRPYARVDRAKLKRKLLERCRDQGKSTSHEQNITCRTGMQSRGRGFCCSVDNVCGCRQPMRFLELHVDAALSANCELSACSGLGS